MTPGGRRILLLAVVCSAVVFAAAMGWLSPPEDTVISGAVPASSSSVEAVATVDSSGSTLVEASAPAPVAESPVEVDTSVVASTSAPPTTQAPTTVAPVGARTLSVLLTGDILTENPVLEGGVEGGAATGARYDFAPLFAPIKAYVESFDLAICQMELPIGRPGEAVGNMGRSPYGGNLLLAPYEMAPSLKAVGFDRCTTASNHSYDVGDAGVDSTIDAFEQVGISWSGTARRPEESLPSTFEWRGIRIAHLSYTRRSNTDLPADEWRLNYTEDPARVIADVAAVREAGAELVIVSIHVFKEMTEQPIALNTDFAAAITAGADIDAVIHHGPHVVQPFEIVNDTPVWWSIGNLLSGMARPGSTGRHSDPRTRDGLGAVLGFREDGPGNWQLDTSSVILCNEESSRVIYPGVAALQDPTLDPALRQQLQECVDRTLVPVPDAR